MGVAFGPVASAFIQSDAPVSVIVGPVGSGKSSATVIKLMRLILGTPPGADGVSRSRTIIVRNTYRELEDSVIKTFFAWVPQSSGEWSPGSLTWRLDVPGRCQHDVMFRSFDSAGDVGKLLSTEYSYGMLSEARELPEELIHMLPARLRYPTQRDVPGFRGRVLIERIRVIRRIGSTVRLWSRKPKAGRYSSNRQAWPRTLRILRICQPGTTKA